MFLQAPAIYRKRDAWSARLTSGAIKNALVKPSDDAGFPPRFPRRSLTLVSSAHGRFFAKCIPQNKSNNDHSHGADHTHNEWIVDLICRIREHGIHVSILQRVALHSLRHMSSTRASHFFGKF